MLSRRLPTSAVTAALAGLEPRPSKALAVATGDGEHAVGTAHEMIVGTSGSWARYPWHRIARGGWNGPASTLKWVTYDGQRCELKLTDPGRIPELFNERIQATIVVNQTVKVPGDDGDGVIVAGRRAVGSDNVEWHASLANGTTWQTPGARETAEVMLARLQAEFTSG